MKNIQTWQLGFGPLRHNLGLMQAHACSVIVAAIPPPWRSARAGEAGPLPWPERLVGKGEGTSV